jgi:hypothetical protein
MAFEVGKRVVAESESTDRQPRSGVVEEILRGDPSPRYRIRWDDGHESILTPASGALRAGRVRKRTKRAAPGMPPSDLISTTKPEPDELARYYRDEDGHIHLLW